MNLINKILNIFYIFAFIFGFWIGWRYAAYISYDSSKNTESIISSDIKSNNLPPKYRIIYNKYTGMYGIEKDYSSLGWMKTLNFDEFHSYDDAKNKAWELYEMNHWEPIEKNHEIE